MPCVQLQEIYSICILYMTYYIPVVPHKAVAEVSE